MGEELRDSVGGLLGPLLIYLSVWVMTKITQYSERRSRPKYGRIGEGFRARKVADLKRIRPPRSPSGVVRRAYLTDGSSNVDHYMPPMSPSELAKLSPYAEHHSLANRWLDDLVGRSRRNPVDFAKSGVHSPYWMVFNGKTPHELYPRIVIAMNSILEERGCRGLKVTEFGTSMMLSKVLDNSEL